MICILVADIISHSILIYCGFMCFEMSASVFDNNVFQFAYSDILYYVAKVANIQRDRYISKIMVRGKKFRFFIGEVVDHMLSISLLHAFFMNLFPGSFRFTCCFVPKFDFL